MKAVTLRAVVVWVMFILAEILNGVLRTLFLAPAVGDFRARQIAVIPGSIAILAISLLTIRWIGARRRGELIAVGFLWLALTLVFEIALGFFVFDYSWQRILSDYNVFNGGMLPVGLLVMTLAPLVSAKARRLL
jgi:hypothetical protein